MSPLEFIHNPEYVSPSEMVEDYGWQENRFRANEWGDGYVSPAEMVRDYGWEYNNQTD